MLLAHEDSVLKVYADTYSLEFAKDRPYVYFFDHEGHKLAELFVLSSIHPLDNRDETTWTETWQVEEGLDEITCSLAALSSAWKSKTYRFHCQPRRLTYQVEVEGEGQIAEANYFGGYYSAQIRWGSGFFQSGQTFKQGFNPEPACDEVYTFPADGNSEINMTGVPLPGMDDWFFTPPPFCFAFEIRRGWLGVSIEARPGRNQYRDFQYHGSRKAFYLTQNFDGHTRVHGRYTLPAVAFDFGPDPYTLLALHVQHLRGAGLAPVPPAAPIPDWWREPIFCGWGAQCFLARQSGGTGPDYAIQSRYEGFMNTLADHGVFPGTVVIDDKWQETYGENEADPAKWPDMAAFVRGRHAAGQHVLLWLKAWAPEGLPPEECVVNAAGLPVSVDPTNPVYQDRLRAAVRRMLSPEGYDVDGFKIDFSARIPSGPGLKTWGDAWGLELMRLYLEIIRDEARRVKPDAFIITHTPHPYLAGLMDAVRLNDINIDQEVRRQMTHRARVAAIACPEALIDSDNWPMRDKSRWRDYLELRPPLGIPALYFVDHIDTTGEALDEDDYALLREVWAGYRQRQAARLHGAAGRKVSELGGVALPEVKHLGLSRHLSVAVKPLKDWPKKMALK